MSTAPAAAPLVTRTVAVDDPGALLSLLPDPGQEPILSWVRRGEGMVGWGETLRIETTGADRFEQARTAWEQVVAHAAVRDEVGLPGCGPVAFASFAFSRRSPAGGVLVVPSVLVGRRGHRWWVTTTSTSPSLPAPATARNHQRPQGPGRVAFSDGARSAQDWTEAVSAVRDRIGVGDVEKVVLARDVTAVSERPIDPRWLLTRLAERYPGCWTFDVDGLVGATPEMLVRRERGLVTSRVLAGTIRRSGDDDRDLALAASLARSSKDLEEHEYAVRSVAEALEPHCRSMNVPDAPFVLHLANVMHLGSDVTGVLRGGVTALDLAQSLHPSAAVCGTPTLAAADVIHDLEGMDRDRYAGPVGWIDAAGDGEFGIALRCGRLEREDPRRIRLFAGCGIVAGSDPAAELAESRAKLLPMREALQDGSGG